MPRGANWAVAAFCLKHASSHQQLNSGYVMKPRHLLIGGLALALVAVLLLRVSDKISRPVNPERTSAGVVRNIPAPLSTPPAAAMPAAESGASTENALKSELRPTVVPNR